MKVNFKRKKLITLISLIGLLIGVSAICSLTYISGVAGLKSAQMKVYGYRLYSRAYLQALSANYDSLRKISSFRATNNLDLLESAYVRLLSGKGVFKGLMTESSMATDQSNLPFDIPQTNQINEEFQSISNQFEELLNNLNIEEELLLDKVRAIEDRIIRLTSSIGRGESIYWESRAKEFNSLNEKNQILMYIYIILFAGIIILIIAYFISTFRQISLEESLEKNRVLFVQSARLASLGEFSSSVAHEINNPLTIIQWRVKQLSEKLQALEISSEVSKSLESIDKQSKRINSIIRGIKTLSKDATHEEFHNFSIVETLEQIHEIILNKSLVSSFDFELKNFDQDAIIYGKQVQLIQVLTNLVNNSFDAIQQFEKRWIKIEGERDKNSILIKVTDSGAGISNEGQNKIFDMFYSTKEKHGTGIGLSLSAKIIESHGGEISYNPNSQNTQFVISLPINSKGA